VLVGLSGGVDSAVAALLLKERGHDVIGVTMAIYDGPPGDAPARHACYDCGEREEIELAREAARRIGIPHHVLDCARQYRRIVLAYFRREYLAGLTPNPCVRCNHLVKFGVLPAAASKSGLRFDLFATGHYARTGFSETYGRHVLRQGVDTPKDQSYFLYRLDQRQLGRTILPLGEMTKAEVRDIARRAGLPMADQPESQDFYSGDRADILEVRDTPGRIVDTAGRQLGTHSGFWRFTPGQRRGLGIAASEPLYVLRVDAARNEVVVGTWAESHRPSCRVGNLRFIVPLEEIETPLRARLRSSQLPVAVSDVLQDIAAGELEVAFAEPQQGMAPGQSLVLYAGDMVVGGGVILPERAQAGLTPPEN
jgi:tRNA-specific 2-thiouridylase